MRLPFGREDGFDTPTVQAYKHKTIQDFQLGDVMNKGIILVAMLPVVAACTTPKTVLKNDKSGQVVTCGGSATGSLVGGVIGYHIQKGNDSDCKADYLEQGFKVVKTDKESD